MPHMTDKWTDGITCSVLRDGDAVAEVTRCVEWDMGMFSSLWDFEVECPNGCDIGTYSSRDAAKAAAERAIRTMRGEGEG